MGDRNLAGGLDVTTFKPVELWAGEGNGKTMQGVAKSGFVFGSLNDQGHTKLFTVVAFDADGKLVPWDPTASNNFDDYASATVTLANAVPVDGDLVTIAGVDVTFLDAPDPDNSLEVAIGATLAESAANLAQAINDSRNDFGVAGGVTASVAGAVVTVRSPGTAGNAVTLTKTFATGANATVSGSPLSGGTDSDAEPGEAALPVGVLPHYLDTSATGYNADVETPYYIGGSFNFAALDVPTGTTIGELQRLFARTPITVQALY